MNGPGEEVQAIRVSVERGQLIPQHGQRLLSFLRFDRLQKLLLSDRELDRLEEHSGSGR